MTKATKPSFGHVKRAEKLSRKRMQIKKHVEGLLERYIVPDFNINDAASMPNPEPIYRHIFTELEDKYPKFSNYRFARYHFSSLINSGNRNSKWLLPVPSFIHRYNRESLFRDEKWFAQSKAINVWSQNWLAGLSHQHAIKATRSNTNLLGNCLISAVLYGGLCIPEALSALIKVLTVDNRPLIKDGNNIFIELIFENKSQPHNILIQDEAKTLRRWYPDPFTLCWINHFLSSYKPSEFESEVPSSWVLMKSVINEVDGNVLKKVKTMKSWCKASVGVIENMPKVDLSQTFIGYMVGNVISVSLPKDVSDVICANNYTTPEINGFSYQNKSSNSSQKRTFNEVPLNAEKAIKEIGCALAPKLGNGHKNSRDKAIVLLWEIKANYPNLSLDLLISWLIDRLGKKLAVSSVLRYWSAIGKTWLAHTLGVQLYLMDSEAFETLYKDMIDTGKSLKSRHYNGARFYEFHLFLHQHYGYPMLMESLNDNSKSPTPFVRATYVPQGAFHLILESISQTIVDKSLSNALQVLLILAIRTGMRIGELTKLQVGDIEDSIENWVFVRNNQFGNNKSTSSLRKIPLNALLHENEKALIRKYLNIRRNGPQGDKTLMFTQGNFFHTPLNSNWVGRIFSVTASKVMNVNCTFHGLRHTALSNLQLILEDDKYMLNQLVGYSPQQVDRIQMMLVNSSLNSSKRDKYWIMASFAGHSTPSTTLASYLHFTDYLLGQAIRKAFCSIPQHAIKTASGLSINALTRLNTSSNNENEWRSNLLEKVEIHLKSATLQIISKATKVDEKTEKQVIQENDSQYDDPDIVVCYSVLRDAENKATLEELVNRYNIRPKTIEKWLTNALELNKVVTSKNIPRLFTKQVHKFRGDVILAPAKLLTKGEINDADKAITQLKLIYKDKKADVSWSIDYFINNSNRSNPYINFMEPSDVSRFLSTLQTVFPAERWHLVVYMHENSIDENNRQWDLLLKKTGLRSEKVSTETKRRYNTKGKLRLRHPDEFEIKKRKGVTNYSSRTLAYILHMLAIMIGPIKYT